VLVNPEGTRRRGVLKVMLRNSFLQSTLLCIIEPCQGGDDMDTSRRETCPLQYKELWTTSHRNPKDRKACESVAGIVPRHLLFSHYPRNSQALLSYVASTNTSCSSLCLISACELCRKKKRNETSETTRNTTLLTIRVIPHLKRHLTRQ
jgi:hypothetical protein